MPLVCCLRDDSKSSKPEDLQQYKDEQLEDKIESLPSLYVQCLSWSSEQLCGQLQAEDNAIDFVNQDSINLSIAVSNKNIIHS